ncbi:cob(I)yrinic acid a,c-diamide adenosyltransferase [Cohnella sp. WQ 127256]|uniref:cob(I)yrinic acid a,c-diamide adenosyltransferase n=1 Tax=Cohnella sp. WQ 127256 TaxID=2938790 RepID=UPI0021173B5E|nr:cob(I)yrinic acid a,c-diamide adenosyltransferase [Cohnella sp. WQ 127256]
MGRSVRNVNSTEGEDGSMSKPIKERGLTLVYTGDGKGKTTAAMGLAVRAVGRGFKVLIIQFIKSPQRTYGEKIVFDKLGIEIHQMGIGFTWTKTPEEHREALKTAWAYAKERIESGEHQLIILDEINNALAISTFPIDDVLPLGEVLEVIRNRPQGMHLVLTGRNAQPEVVEIADLVTEMKPIKHYYEEGVSAVMGIEM